VLAVSSVNAQVLKVWKDDSATNFNVSTQVDSIAFKSDSLKLFGSGSDVSYSVSGDLDSVTFAEGVHYGSMTDERDGKVYKTVEIGEQTWMAENLNYGGYLKSDGGSSAFQKVSQKYCYENSQLNCDSLGGLYQWHTTMGFEKSCSDGSMSCSNRINSLNHQGICPRNWHVPKEAEWDTLHTCLRGRSVAGKRMKLSRTGFSNWDSPIYNDGNSSGFSTVPAGQVSGTYFSDYGERASFWEASERDSVKAYHRYLTRQSRYLNRFSPKKDRGISVRCLKD
jgi:uncharacterized protein (TIGR02145 family)